MRRLLTTLAAGIGLLAASLPADAVAQAVRTQQLTFGGGSHFDFALPVGHSGRISVEIQMPAGTPVEGFLFSPRAHDYAAMGRGVGSLFLSHNIEGKRADVGEWRLDVVVPTEQGTTVGTLRVTWPVADEGADPLIWLNAGPTDPDDLAAIADGLGQLDAYAHQINGGSLGDADLDRIAAVVGTRLNVLSGVPAGYVQNDYAEDRVSDRPLRIAPSGGPVNVSLVEFAAYQQGYWHPGRSSGRSYVVAAVLPASGGSAVGGQSKLYKFDCSNPYAHRTKPVKVTHQTGEALLLPAPGEMPAGELLVAVLEREHASAGSSLQEFLHGAELFAAYRERVGPSANRYLPWLLDLALGRGDGVVGTPRLITLERGSPADTLVDRDLRFVQSDADYGVTIRVVAANSGK